MISLDIYSDPVCPWCYFGKVQLDRALAERPDHPFTIRWRPFQLNPDMPPGGYDRAAYLEAKFGGQSGAARAYAPVLETADRLGLAIDFAAIPRQPNTLDAHRLIHWAELEGRQPAVVAALFRAFFEECLDIGDRDTLCRIGTEAGMEAGMLARLFASDADSDRIAEADGEARRRGIQGVPCFIVGNQYALSGAQPTELWLQVIDELRAEAGA